MTFQKLDGHKSVGDLLEALSDSVKVQAVNEDGAVFGVQLRCSGRYEGSVVGCSYRGFYEDLALSPVAVADGDSAQELHAALWNLLGETMIGYKGGMYDIDRRTRLWLAAWGECGEAVTGIQITGDVVSLAVEEWD